MTRFFSAGSAALLAWFAAKALNVPVWRDWDMGDQFDFALTGFLTVWWGIRAVRPS